MMRYVLCGFARATVAITFSCDAPRYHPDEVVCSSCYCGLLVVFSGGFCWVFVLLSFLFCWVSLPFCFVCSCCLLVLGCRLSVCFWPCASVRRLARCMSSFCLFVFLCGCVVFFLFRYVGTQVSEMMQSGLFTLIAPLLLELLFSFAGSLLGVPLPFFVVPRCFVGGCWMIIRCIFGRPEPWTGLCCSEQRWCSRLALCRTIWGALVQQRLLAWHSLRCPFSVWMLFLLKGRVKCSYWMLYRICLYFSTTMHCRSIRDDDTLDMLEQFGGGFVLHFSLLAAPLSADMW